MKPGRVLPAWAAELTAPAGQALADLGVTVLTDAVAHSYESGVLIATQTGKAYQILAEKVLVTVGRRPRSRSAGIVALDLAMQGPFIHIDAQCRTTMREVFAIGDVTGEPMLAHRAMAPSEMVAKIVAGRSRTWDHRAMPKLCFTDPEVVSIGLLPAEAALRGGVKTAVFPFSANGKALSEHQTKGFVRIIADANGRRIPGLQAVGAAVSELAGEFVLAMERQATLGDISATIHAHPTRSESFHEATLRTLGRALHL